MPSLDLNQENDIIRIEKILKAEIKLNGKANINDVENLLTFLRKDGSKFLPLLQHKTIRIILNAEGKTINFAPFDRTDISDETLNDFAQTFASNIEGYLRECIRVGAWFSLKSVFINYSFLVTELAKESVLQLLTHKNRAIIQAIYNHQLTTFVNFNRFCKDAGYYSILSIIDSHYFDDDILTINNAISNNQNTSASKLKLLGEILYALTYYNAHSEDLKATLANNQPIALKWSSSIETTGGSDNHTMLFAVYIVAAAVIILLVASGVSGAGVIAPIIIAIARLISKNSR